MFQHVFVIANTLKNAKTCVKWKSLGSILLTPLLTQNELMGGFRGNKTKFFFYKLCIASYFSIAEYISIIAFLYI